MDAFGEKVVEVIPPSGDFFVAKLLLWVMAIGVNAAAIFLVDVPALAATGIISEIVSWPALFGGGAAVKAIA